jgi:hypothetical protein
MDHGRRLPKREVKNPINGHSLWTVGRLAPIKQLCRDLYSEGFKVTDTGLVDDLLGEPLLDFLRDPKATSGNARRLGEIANGVVAGLRVKPAEER